ncbi:MAG: oxidoreductase [Aestuariivirga sp.]
MAALNIREPVEEAIERLYESRQEPQDHPTLRASEIGDECERRLWYRFRWVLPPKRWDGRMLRLFETGQREEVRIIENLEAIGCTITDSQGKIEPQAQGMLTGSIDGEVTGVPGAEKTPHLLECKTHNDASWQSWRRHGVKKSHPKHYAQMQLYMHGRGLSRALYMAHNKDTDDLGAERVKFDMTEALRLVAKAERIAFAQEPPPRLSEKPDFWTCKLCDFRELCHGQQIARRNCRTCIFASAGHFGCLYGDPADRTVEEQQAGCQMHLYIPGLVPGQQVDADEDAGTIIYRLRDGSTFVDGGE